MPNYLILLVSKPDTTDYLFILNLVHDHPIILYIYFYRQALAENHQTDRCVSHGEADQTEPVKSPASVQFPFNPRCYNFDYI
jgi:hypothetical protein